MPSSPSVSCSPLHTQQIQAENSARTVSAAAAYSNRLERATQAGRLAGRLSARLASIRFCLSVNNMASCVCVVVLTTAPDRAPSPPPRPFTAAPATSLCSACGLHYAAFAHFNSHPEWRQQSERCSQRASRRRNGGVKSVMCRLGKIVLGFAALILPSLKCSRRSRNQSAKSADQRREV